MKTILYATDYSLDSVSALTYAQKLAIKLDVGLSVIHVYNSSTLLDSLGLRGDDPFPDKEDDIYQKQMTKILQFCKTHLHKDTDMTSINCDVINNKSVLDGILQKANDLNPFLIITGIKSRNTLKGVIVGSTNKQLLKKSPCPVLTIPSDLQYLDIKTIVYATDFEEEDLGALKALTELAKPLQAKIVMLHIAPENDTYSQGIKKVKEERVRKLIDYTNITLEILYSDDVFADLKSYLASTNADVIAMLERESKSFLSNILHRDLVKKMQSYGKIPIVSYNAENYGIFHL